jgi:prenyltransferase beta subunit
MGPIVPHLHALTLAVGVVLVCATAGGAQDAGPQDDASGAEEPIHADRQPPRLDVLSDAQWQRIDDSIERASLWLLSQQSPDGSFVTKPSGQPGVTALCAMAFLSSGHLPGQGPHGESLDKAIDFVIDCQRDDGLFSLQDTHLPADVWTEATHAATYNHAISGLMLGEVYGQTDAARARKIAPAIHRALEYTRRMQLRRKRFEVDKGAWRYIKDVPISSSGGGDADLSATAWHILFLRSAKNAEFNVPTEYVRDALQFIRNCYQPETGAFTYALYTNGRVPTRATTGAGVLCLFLSGRHDRSIEKKAGQWIVDHPFRPYNGSLHVTDRYFYSAYYCSQAAFQLGGRYWEAFYPGLAEVFLENQAESGAWDAEAVDREFGNAYSTALAVLALTPPYQLLPIYQR